jgi:methionyl-tRNA formyltransferase
MTLRLVFMGTPDFAATSLAAVLASGHEVTAVYSQPPRRAGRGMADTKSPVHELAESRGIPVFTPKSLKAPAEQAEFAALNADAAVVVAYGLLLPRAILDAPRLGCYNLHASALPRWRGAAPIQRAIMAGDTETAAMVMRMEEGLDTGPVCMGETVAIGPNQTASELHDVLASRGAALLVQALNALDAGRLTSTPQASEGVTYAAKIDKAEARIDFSKPARDVHNHIRGLSPFPGAWFEAKPASGEAERIKVLRSAVVNAAGRPGHVLDGELTIACGDEAIKLVEVQRAGKKPMAASEFLRGFALAKGARVNQS